MGLSGIGSSGNQFRRYNFNPNGSKADILGTASNPAPPPPPGNPSAPPAAPLSKIRRSQGNTGPNRAI